MSCTDRQLSAEALPNLLVPAQTHLMGVLYHSAEGKSREFLKKLRNWIEEAGFWREREGGDTEKGGIFPSISLAEVGKIVNVPFCVRSGLAKENGIKPRFFL